MRYTALRVVEAGVVLYAQHRARLAPEGPAALLAFAHFAATAAPGVYALSAVGEALTVAPRPASRLFDGMPARLAVSPVAHRRGAQAKQPSPSPYDAVRIAGVATLLTSADGHELYEACSAAMLAYSGKDWRVVPPDRPRVASVTEAALRELGGVVEAPLLCDVEEPLVLVNAIKGVCTVVMPGRAASPANEVARLAAFIESTTRRG